MTPGTGAEAVPGLTDFEARSGGEGEVGASVIGTYWFAQSVDEMTVHPRPASPEPTTVVETDHPLCSCQWPPSRRGPATGPVGPDRHASSIGTKTTHPHRAVFLRVPREAGPPAPGHDIMTLH